MREVFVPELVAYPTKGNITNFIAERAYYEPDRVMLSRALGENWQPITARELEAEVRGVAKGLIASGIQLGDRVAIMSRTRYEWTIIDFAIWYAGGVPVPIYETSSAEQIDWILSDSGATGIFVETPQLAELAQSVLPKHTKHVWTITDDAVYMLTHIGSNISDSEIDQRRNAVNPESLATLIYTSGTTGNPKGVQLTHGGFMFECTNVVQAASDLFLEPGGKTLLFLPLAHVFGRMIEVGAISAGLHLAHCSDVINRLTTDLITFKPTFVLAVPRVFEKVYNSAEAKAIAGGKGPIFKAAAATAIAYSQSLDKGKTSTALNLRHKLFDHLVYSKIRAALGGNARAAISGGAALGDRLSHFFRGIGVNILEGYGLTETSAGTTLNFTYQSRIGSVGRPIPGNAVRIADDGEVLIKGPIVMSGYWKNEAANREVFDGEWFKSGDLGTLDGDGFLYITGRKKELIITAGGKNVAPAVLEDRLRSHPLISQCMVVGDNQPYIAALITLETDTLKTWVETNKKVGASLSDLTRDPDLISVIQTAVDETNKAVSRAESIRRFVLLDRDFTIAGGHLTAKLSIKRHVVAKEFAESIKSLYS